MKWLDFLRELDDVRSKIRSGHHLMEQVNWEMPFLANLLFVLTEHQVTPRQVPIVEEVEATPPTRNVTLAGRVVKVKGEKEMKVTPLPREKDNTVNKKVDLKATDEDGKVLVEQPPLGDGAVWVEGDS